MIRKWVFSWHETWRNYKVSWNSWFVNRVPKYHKILVLAPEKTSNNMRYHKAMHSSRVLDLWYQIIVMIVWGILDQQTSADQHLMRLKAPKCTVILKICYQVWPSTDHRGPLGKWSLWSRCIGLQEAITIDRIPCYWLGITYACYKPPLSTAKNNNFHSNKPFLCHTEFLIFFPLSTFCFQRCSFTTKCTQG